MLSTNFMQLSGDVSSMSCMDFFEAVIFVQFQLTLPSIAFMYLVVTCIGDEIKRGILHLYKDIPRKKIFLYKAISILAWYGLYFAATFSTSVLTYYTYVIKQPYASGLFYSNNIEDIQYVIIGLLGIILSTVLNIFLTIVLSMFLNNGTTLIIGILFTLFCSLAPELEKINYFFTTGYLQVYERIGFYKSLSLIFITFFIYIIFILFLGSYKLRRIEY